MAKKKKHKYVPWIVAKNDLMEHFEKWRRARDAYGDARDMIEFLYQEGYIQGKAWLEYLDDIQYPITWIHDIKYMEPMREGYIPPKSFVGPIK